MTGKFFYDDYVMFCTITLYYQLRNEKASDAMIFTILNYLLESFSLHSWFCFGTIQNCNYRKAMYEKR